MNITRSTAALLLLGSVVSLSACASKPPAVGNPVGNAATAPSPGDDAKPAPPEVNSPAQDTAPTPAQDTAAPPSDTPIAPAMDVGPVADVGSQDVVVVPAMDANGPGPADAGGLPRYDAGVSRGCNANPNPADPTAGWTEFTDPYPPAAGVEYPNLEYPYNLAPQDNCTTTVPITSMASPCRFGLKNGVYTFWIFQNDLTHKAPASGVAPTAPRSEIHWSDWKANDAHPQRMWSADMVVRGSDQGSLPGNNCLMQVHTHATGQGPVYLRVDGGRMFQLGGPNYYTPRPGTWFNLKVAFNARTLQSTVWVNDCQVGTWNGSSFVGANLPGGDTFYFKMGSYGCSTGVCINQFANVRWYWK